MLFQSPQVARFSKLPDDPTRQIIGAWLVDTDMFARFVLYRRNGKVYLETKFKSGNTLEEEMVEYSKGKIYLPLPARGSSDRLLIKYDGSLTLQDWQGTVMTGTRI